MPSRRRVEVSFTTDLNKCPLLAITGNDRSLSALLTLLKPLPEKIAGNRDIPVSLLFGNQRTSLQLVTWICVDNAIEFV
jgi:hypothetical protein